MIRRMKLLLGMVISLICGLTTISPAVAQSNTASTKYFSAKVVNIRRAATGKTLVTVLFSATSSISSFITFYAGTEECRKSATLIDGDGNEYATLRCMSPSPKNGFGRAGMRIEGGSSSSFVYEFSTPLSSERIGNGGIDIVIPLEYEFCFSSDGRLGEHRSNVTGFINVGISTDRCQNSTTSLSFYGLTAR